MSITSLIKASGDPGDGWLPIELFHDGDVDVTDELLAVFEDPSKLASASPETVRSYAIVWLDENRETRSQERAAVRARAASSGDDDPIPSSGLRRTQATPAPRAAVVRAQCCPAESGHFPALAGLYWVPGVGPVLESSWTAVKLVDEVDGHLGKTGILGGTTVLAQCTETVKVRCPTCAAVYPVDVLDLQDGARRWLKERRRSRTILVG